MIHSHLDMKKWGKEQVGYFSRYMDSFPTDSVEHKMLDRGLKELKKIL
jgi:hypothetical protein